MVPTCHTPGVGTGGTKIFGRKRDDTLIGRLSSRESFGLHSALNRYPFIPRTRVSDSLHDAHVSQAVFEVRMGMHSAL